MSSGPNGEAISAEARKARNERAERLRALEGDIDTAFKALHIAAYDRIAELIVDVDDLVTKDGSDALDRRWNDLRDTLGLLGIA